LGQAQKCGWDKPFKGIPTSWYLNLQRKKTEILKR
jgi:hypothetical protein